MKKSVEYYMGLDYKVVISPANDESGRYWIAELPDLDGCSSDGKTQEEAVRNLAGAKRAWISFRLSKGLSIPEPNKANAKTEEEYGGRITLRMGKSMHKMLAEMAQLEGLSLNQYILSLVSYRFGQSKLDFMKPEHQMERARYYMNQAWSDKIELPQEIISWITLKN
ncbi:MAG TPA: toxin-antitoxin system HicB family antitoxin [Selenomonadales bacterium]|nr:toxin-antitoxin system HicB family antitoxin [Selenomonadales bacterium]